MGPVSYRIWWALRWNEGRLVSYGALIDVAWGDDPEGGPLHARETLAVLVDRLRRAKRERWIIECRAQHGFLLRRR